MKEIVGYCPTSKLGVGFPLSSFEAALKRDPDYIGLDAGSSDTGPFNLGSGQNTAHPREGQVRDLQLLIPAAIEHEMPLLVGTAGHAGGNPHLQLVREILEEVVKKNNLHLRVAYIHAEQKKEFLKKKLADGKIKPLNPWGFSQTMPISNKTIDGSARIVAVMGTEPYMKALDKGAQVVIAGRSADPAVLAAVPLKRGFPPGPVWHASQVACDGYEGFGGVPDGLIARIERDHFVIEHPDPRAKCDRTNIIELALHETGSPFRVYQPSGVIDTTKARFEQLSENSVKVTGSIFESTKYTLKLEGVRKVGYRTIFFGGIRDRQIISQIDDWLAALRKTVESALQIMYGRDLSPEEYSMNFRVYGKNGVMGALEPIKQITSHEVFILAEVIASTEEMSYAISQRARQTMMHFPALSGSRSETTLALPFSPMNIKVGAVYRWSMNHVVEVDDASEIDEMFQIEIVDY